LGELTNAESAITSARLNLNIQKTIYERNKILFRDAVISKSEFEEIERAYLAATETLNLANSRYSIVKTGNLNISRESNTVIVSTINGVISSIPSKVGASIIQSNNFNDGTTIAKVANTNELVFEGKVKEYEIGSLVTGMPVMVKLAINDEEVEGELTEISTSGKDVNGTILFDIKSKIRPLKAKRIGFSANAKILIRERKNVLAVKEDWFRIRKDSVFVWIHKNANEYVERYLKTGISDDVFTEVLEGLKENEYIRNYDK
jgi:HlyD family secretion protein